MKVIRAFLIAPLMRPFRRSRSRKGVCSSFLAAGLFLFPLGLSGTTIVVIKTKSGVVVGADSALSRNGAVADHVCKLIVTDDFVFAASGSYYPEHGLDIFEIARQASQMSGSLSSKTAAYIAYVLPALKSFLEWDKTGQPEEYNRLLEIGASEVIFVDRHSLEVIHLWFPVYSSGIPYAKTLDDWNQPLVGDNFELQVLGHADEIYKTAKKDLLWFRKPEKNAAKFLKLAATAYPLEVGPPFSIVHINSAGFRWLKRGRC